jgi:hypothetical protein
MVPALFHEKTNKVDAQIGVSRDGIEWFRFRDAFLPLGAEGQWDAGTIYPTPSEVTVGGKNAIYYQADRVGHGPQAGKPGIGFGLMHEGGFAGWRADGKGIITTVPIQVRYTQDYLCLNAQAAAGSITAELLDTEGHIIPKFSRAESKPIHADGTMLQLLWDNNVDINQVLARGAFRLKLYLENATVNGIRCKQRPRTPPVYTK